MMGPALSQKRKNDKISARHGKPTQMLGRSKNYRWGKAACEMQGMALKIFMILDTWTQGKRQEE